MDGRCKSVVPYPRIKEKELLSRNKTNVKSLFTVTNINADRWGITKQNEIKK